MSVFAWIFVWFAVARLLGFRRRRRRWMMFRFPEWQSATCAPVPAGYGSRRARQAAEVPRLTAFEQIKSRYVSGEIDDEQYERELDALLRTPEGRRQLS